MTIPDAREKLLKKLDQKMKKAIFGKGSKASHLTYVGDAEVGEDVNFG